MFHGAALGHRKKATVFNPQHLKKLLSSRGGNELPRHINREETYSKANLPQWSAKDACLNDCRMIPYGILERVKV